MLHESVVRGLHRLHQVHHILGSIQREIFYVHVERRHHLQLRLHRGSQLLQLCLRTEGAALGRRGSAFITFHNKIIGERMDPSVSIEYERLALEIKYLLTLEEKVPEEQALAVLNQLYPFNNYPLTKLPPL